MSEIFESTTPLWSSGDSKLFNVHPKLVTLKIIIILKQTYKMYNFSLMEDNCQSLDQSLQKNEINVRKEANRIEISNENGVSVSCDFHYDLYTVTLDGWHHGKY